MATDRIVLAGLISVSDWGGRIQPREQDFVLDPDGVCMAIPASYSRHHFNILEIYGLSRTRDRRGKIVGRNLNRYVNTLTSAVGSNSNMDVQVVEVIDLREGPLCSVHPNSHKFEFDPKTSIKPYAPTLRATDYKCPHCAYIPINENSMKEPIIIGDTYGFEQEARTYEDYSPALRSERSGLKVGTPLHIKEATAKGYAEAHEGDSVNLAVPNSQTRRGRVGKQIANTLDTGCQQGVVIVDGIAYRIRKLTPRECFRLMGVDDTGIDKIQAAGISNTQQYKMAGNSIVVDNLFYIFRNLFTN